VIGISEQSNLELEAQAAHELSKLSLVWGTVIVLVASVIGVTIN
jgi:hypothetical protein